MSSTSSYAALTVTFVPASGALGLETGAWGLGDGLGIKDHPQVPFMFENLALDCLCGGMATDRIGDGIPDVCRELNDEG